MRTHTVNIANTGKPHLVAKVQTPQGIANIDLGPEANLSALNLQKGNQIKVYGVQGKINDNFLLLADRVQVEGQRVKINRNDARPLHTFNATVLSTRTLSRNQQKILLARLQLQNGTKTIVNLGPQKQLPVISHGQQIQVLARLTEIQGKKALIADRLRTQGQTYRIDWNQQQKEAS